MPYLQVVYDAALFLEKNRDNLSRNVLQLLRATRNPLIAILFAAVDGTATLRTQSRMAKNMDTAKLSVSANFKNSLLDLMDKMLAATPHFIRFDTPISF